MNLPVKIASRCSPLALAQVEEIIQNLKAKGVLVTYEILKYETGGDKDRSTPLTSSRDDFFTDAIDIALQKGQTDIAVHSAKDLPKNLPEGLEIFALTRCLDNKDAWVGRTSWAHLPPRAKVGTSSLLRQKQVLRLRPDINLVDIRGSIGERLEMVKKGQVDGIVVAACALKRLKLEGEIKDIFPWEGQTLQGQLAIVGRKEDHQLKDLFSVLDVRRPKTLLHCGTNPEIYSHLGKIIHWPMIDIRPVSINEPSLKQILQALGSTDIIIFTSRHAVLYFFKMLLSVKPLWSLEAKTFAVVGEQTQRELQKFDIQAAIAAKEETAQGLLKAISEHINVQGKRILFPRSSIPNPFLKDALTAHGAIVTEVTVYENTKPARRNLPSLDIDGVIFTSPSTVRNFLTDYDTIPGTWQIMAKGPVTLRILKEKGYLHAASLS